MWGKLKQIRYLLIEIREYNRMDHNKTILDPMNYDEKDRNDQKVDNERVYWILHGTLQTWDILK